AIVAVLSGPGRSDLARFLIRRRWFAAKARGIGALDLLDWAVLDPHAPLVLLLLSIDGDRYYVPVTVSAEAAPDAALGRVGGEAVVDAHDDPRFGRRVLAAIAAARSLDGRHGRFGFRPTPGWAFPADPDSQPARRLTGEQSNTSVVVGDLVLKSLRRPQPGLNPDLEITRFLTTRTAFRHVPRLAGWMEYAGAGEAATLAVLQEFVPNSGDAWTHVLSTLTARGGAVEQRPDPLVDDIRRLGAITGGLHAALASGDADPDFRPEPVGRDDIARWAGDIAREVAAEDIQRQLGQSRLAGHVAPGADVPGRVARTLAGLEAGASPTVKIRVHGDYHLGQVLKTPTGFVIIDFEGEPARPLAERRLKQSALRDVAGMLRSLDYAAHAVAFGRPEATRAAALAALTGWEGRARHAFLDGYEEAVAASPVPLVPPSPVELRRACAAFELQKACYELRYELNNRPDWAPIPLAGIDRIIRRL
ncbi:MAG: maltokinase N-terminal cap-like domain-containing protein, partial [Candidatus Rokuibacteriota bacterium]